jgi:hypothetical protein
MKAHRIEAVSEPALFDNQERILIEEAMTAVTERAPDDAAQLDALLARLAKLNDMLATWPSLRNDKHLAGEQRDEDSLSDHLTQIDGLSGDLELPFKATLSRTFLLAKIQFLRALVRVTTSHRNGDPSDRFHRLSLELREEFAQSIYTLLAEELLLALLRKPNVTKAIKYQAADQLITIWDNAQQEIDDFCPLLEAAWHARNRITSKLGCLLGASEYFRLVCEDCPPQFFEFFGRDDVSLAEKQAFEEFLFNMTYEELQTLGTAMRDNGKEAITTEWACEVLGRTIEELDPSGEIDPMALYRSYYRRQLAADFRILADTDGPRRTAEAYLMVWLLDQQR